MGIGLADQAIREEVFESLQEDKPPFAAYVKTIVGKLLVHYLDPIRLKPAEVVLKGEPGVGLEEDMIIKVWSSAEDIYLKRNNRKHFEAGRLVPFTSQLQEVSTVNQISDADIELILQKPYFTLKNKLEEFTSPTPVRRFLIMAKKMNRPIGTIDHIKSVLEEMETTPAVSDDAVVIEM